MSIDQRNELKINLELNALYDIWQEFCEQHTSLYELTCDEYIKLLASEIDDLEELMQQKNSVLSNINELDKQRRDVIKNICHLFGEQQEPQKIKDFILVLNKYEKNDIAIGLEKMNLLLIGIIQKIQEQNKKNQIFLNKAILSLKELRSSFNGEKNYDTYGANGLVK